jgi:hypothetical protein
MVKYSTSQEIVKMIKELRRILFEEFVLNPAPLFETVAAEKEPLLVEKEGQVFRLELIEWSEPSTIWAHYDPQLVRAGLQRSAGALSGVDRDELISDIHQARQQDSYGETTRSASWWPCP